MRDSKRSKVILVREVLEILLSQRRSEPPTALLKLADRLTGAERREADWRGFRELVRDLERGADHAFTVVRWLYQLYEAGTEVPRPPLEAGDAVSLMTIHAAKGPRLSDSPAYRVLPSFMVVYPPVGSPSLTW